jgi:pyrroloquinoline quinone biosynthesis protein B
LFLSSICDDMKITVLGPAVTGAPCCCDGAPCTGAGNTARPLLCTHPALAVSPDGTRWALLNAPRDLGTRLRDAPALNPRRGMHQAPIAAVVLLDAHIDHVSGLLSLREGPPVELHCTPCVFEDLTSGLPILPLLQHYCGVRWHLLPVAGDRHSAEFRIAALPGLRFLAMAIDGIAPSYSPHRHDPGPGDHIGLLVEDDATGERLLYAPGLAHCGEDERLAMVEATEGLLDGVI